MHTTKVVQKKQLYCTNCGKNSHEYKHCRLPITSFGIILVNTQKYVISKHDLVDNKLINVTYDNKVNISSMADQLAVSDVFKIIQFLMISRKHSLGYSEFVRGRYKPHMIDQTVYLFRQMKLSEMEKIEKSCQMQDGFEYLWNDIWGSHMTPFLMREKQDGKMKYDALKFNGVNSPDISLEFILKNVKPDYTVDEWGFPKGRRNRGESDEECASREFKEETGYEDADFKIIKEIQPIREIFTGTNGIKYCHIYYVAELTNNKQPANNITKQQNEEIGDIRFFDYYSALDIIRDYHIERKLIVKNIFSYYLKKIIEGCCQK